SAAALSADAAGGTASLAGVLTAADEDIENFWNISASSETEASSGVNEIDSAIHRGTNPALCPACSSAWTTSAGTVTGSSTFVAGDAVDCACEGVSSRRAAANSSSVGTCSGSELAGAAGTAASWGRSSTIAAASAATGGS